MLRDPAVWVIFNHTTVYGVMKLGFLTQLAFPGPPFVTLGMKRGHQFP